MDLVEAVVCKALPERDPTTPPPLEVNAPWLPRPRNHHEAGAGILACYHFAVSSAESALNRLPNSMANCASPKGSVPLERRARLE